MKMRLITLSFLIFVCSIRQPQCALGYLYVPPMAYQPFYLTPGQTRVNGQVTLVYQSDGNLCLYKGSQLLWCALGSAHAAGIANFQADGNLVLYDNVGAYWASGTQPGVTNPTLTISSIEPFLSINAGYASNDPSLNTNLGPFVIWSSSLWRLVNNPDPFGATQHWISAPFFSFWWHDDNGGYDINLYFDNLFKASPNVQYLSKPACDWPSYDMRDPYIMDREIKNTMSAGIDILFGENNAPAMDRILNQGQGYINSNAAIAGLRNFFQTIKTLRDNGYSTPKVAEWVNFELFYQAYWTAHSPKNTLDLGNDTDRDYFYKTFLYGYWSNYFAVMGTQAVSELALYNGKIIVSFDNFYGLNDPTYPGQLINVDDNFFIYLENRFLADFGYKPYFTCNANTYYSSRPTSDVATWVKDTVHFNYIQEPDCFFGPPNNSISNFNWGYDTQNGYVLDLVPGHVGTDFLQSLRKGGNTYNNGLTKAITERSDTYHPTHHLAVTSWNYFPEGCQITESFDETSSTTTNADWGTADPRQYILATANFAKNWNDRAAENADILAVNAPPTMKVGHSSLITVIVRNSGNISWTGAAGYQLHRVNTGDSFSQARNTLIDDSADEIPVYRGVFVVA